MSLKAPFQLSQELEKRPGWCTASTQHRVALALHAIAAAPGAVREGIGACHR